MFSAAKLFDFCFISKSSWLFFKRCAIWSTQVAESLICNANSATSNALASGNLVVLGPKEIWHPQTAGSKILCNAPLNPPPISAKSAY